MKKFAFIVHLREIKDVAYTLPIPHFIVTKILRRPILWLFWRLRGRWGFMVRSRFRVDSKTEGYILVIWLTGNQMMSTGQNSLVKKRILEAVLYAQNKLNCEVIGLGALTASVTSAGQWIANRGEVTASITHGDSYAMALTLEGIGKIVEKKKMKLSKSTVAIVGATGIIGEALSRILALRVGKLILIARRTNKLMALKETIDRYSKNHSGVNISTNIKTVKEADIIVTATSWPEALIKDEHLKQGAVVYEVSQPRNVSQSIIKNRTDVLVIDGAYARVPENIKFWWMSLPPHTTFGCMAETMIQTMVNGHINHVGKIDIDFVKKIRQIGNQYGFKHAELTSFNQRINIENA